MFMRGIILAGGKSSRFGGDKALALIDGIPMIQHAARLLKKLQLDLCVISHEARDYSFLDCRIENDLIPHFGPLGGLYTAFSIFEKESLMILTCDMPLVTCEMVSGLSRAHDPTNEITVYQKGDGTPEPFPGIYEPCLKTAVRDCLDVNQLSMRQFIGRIERKKLLPLLFDADILMNINFKNDFQYLLQKNTGRT